MEETRLLLKIPEADLALGVSRALIYRLLALGRIRRVTIGRVRRIPVEEILRVAKEGVRI
jgi:excisionase family DNA binding protein